MRHCLIAWNNLFENVRKKNKKKYYSTIILIVCHLYIEAPCKERGGGLKMADFSEMPTIKALTFEVLEGVKTAISYSILQ